MTALMSLTSRLALARVALHIRADQADLRRLQEFLLPAVDLLVIGSDGDVERDVAVIEEFRTAYARVPLLLATDNPEAAVPASADVVYFDRPAWKLFGHHEGGHEWSLVGRGARDARTVRKPGEEWTFLFIPVEGGASSPALEAAVSDQPPLTDEALPWFAHGNFTVADVRALVGRGVRRVALTGDALERDGDAASLVSGIRAVIDEAWEVDPAARPFSLRAAAR